MPHHDGFADLVTLVGCDDELLGQLIALLSDIGSSTATRSKGLFVVKSLYHPSRLYQQLILRSWSKLEHQAGEVFGRGAGWISKISYVHNPLLPFSCCQVLLLPFLRALRRLASSDDETTSDAVSNRLVGVGAPRLVVCLMSWAESTNDEAVMLQCLNLACSLVKGGVRAAQDSFLQEVSSHFSSQFFSSLMHIVKSCDLRFPTIKVSFHVSRCIASRTSVPTALFAGV